jgi:TolA-binding protein
MWWAHEGEKRPMSQLRLLPWAAVPGLLVLLQLAGIPGARAQMETREGIALQNQILELRHELQQLQAQGGRGGAPAGGSYLGRAPAYPPGQAPNSDLVAQLLSRVDSLEDQVRQLRGQVEEVQNQVQRQGADLSKRIDDLAFQTGGRAAEGSGQSSINTAVSRPAPAPAPPPAAPARRTPEMLLQEGNAALARRDYTAAEQAAREVLNNYKSSPRSYDAQFLLAQALAGARQYPQAAIAYDDAYNRSRKGSHAQDSLLGLANSLTAINEKRAACDTLTKLRTEFPSPRADLRDSIISVSQRAGCR